MLRIISGGAIDEFISSRAFALDCAEQTVKPILDDVAIRGLDALEEYALRFDDLGDQSVRVDSNDILEAHQALSSETKRILEGSRQAIRGYAEFQMPKEAEYEAEPGLFLGQIVRPLETVGCYVPGGVYPLPSTLLMTAIPAQVAGVSKIIVTNPRPSPVTLGAAGMLGLSDFFRVGGAQAIAAMAFGAGPIPKVDRIVGPGNQYVAAAKRLLAGTVAIDSVAGPSEVVVVADEGDPNWIAADLLAQCEHDVEASGILITTSRALAEAVASEVERQLGELSTGSVARQAIEKASAAILADSRAHAMEIVNQLAPEHLCLHDPSQVSDVVNAGSVFVGPLSVEALGDYRTGPNHVLPTGGAARSRAGLSVLDYVKVISTQKVERSALERLAPDVAAFARLEGLEAHARSVESRL